MNRREAVRIIPLTLAGLVNFIRHAGAAETMEEWGSLPPVSEYQKNILEMLTEVQETQSENLLESAYAISRKLLKGNTFWLNWDQGHSTRSEMFPGRNGFPLFCTQGYDMKKSKKGDILMANRSLRSGSYDDLVKKDIFVIGSSSPWGGDVIGAKEYVRPDIEKLQIRPYSRIWIENSIDCFGGRIYIPGQIAPTGPVSGALFITIMYMIFADVCRILAIEGKPVPVDGDEPALSERENVNWVDLADPLMDNFLDQIRREMELIGSELGDLRKIASMVVDTLLSGGTVYYYSRYSYAYASETTGRRSGLTFATSATNSLTDGNIKGTSKDCVVMGVYKPDDEADLKNLDQFKKIGMRVASIGPISRDYEIPQGRAVHKETEAHVGRMMDTYGYFAIPGFEKKVCPTSGIMIFTIHWTIGLEVIRQIQERTGGNLPSFNLSGALKLNDGWPRPMVNDRGY